MSRETRLAYHAADRDLAHRAASALRGDPGLMVRMDCFSREEFENTLALLPDSLRERVVGRWPVFKLGAPA
jgi:hypothetical protein